MLLTDLIQFIKKHKESTKRTVFDFTHLNDWVEWAVKNKYAFISKNDKQDINGVVVVCPIGKWSETPNMEQVIDSLSKKHTGDTDYFIMDALVDNCNVRLNLSQNIVNKYPSILNNNTKVFAQKGENIWLIPTKHLINFTKY